MLDFIHKGAHIKDPSTSRVQKIIRVGRVGQLGRIKPFPVIPDVNRQCILFSNKSDIHLFVRGAFVAVHYGVYDRFVHRKLNPTRVVLIESNLCRYTFGNRGDQIDELDFAVD